MPKINTATSKFDWLGKFVFTELFRLTDYHACNLDIRFEGSTGAPLDFPSWYQEGRLRRPRYLRNTTLSGMQPQTLLHKFVGLDNRTLQVGDTAMAHIMSVTDADETK